MTKITAYPVGNGDTLRLDLRDGRKVLVDYADMKNRADRTDKQIDLPAALRADLRLAGRDYHDITAFTHLDKDHNVGAGEFFEFDHADKYQGGGRIKMPTMWVPASALTDVGTDGCARLIREEAKQRAERRLSCSQRLGRTFTERVRRLSLSVCEGPLNCPGNMGKTAYRHAN